MLLPGEILDHILSFLQSDTTTLKTCSKSHSILSQLAERHLYVDVTVEDGPNEICKVLRDRPRIANYVRTLHIEFGVPHEAFLEDILFILPRLLMLRKLRLACIAIEPMRLYIPEKIQLALTDCLRFPSLADICMEFVTFPLSMFSASKHIKHLTLAYWCDEPTTATGDSVASLPTINSLTLDYCEEGSLSNIFSWIKSRHLSSLTFFGERLGPSFPFPEILTCCSHSLTNLDVRITPMYNSRYSLVRDMVTHSNHAIPIPLSLLSNLQQLTLRARLDSINTPQRKGFLSPIPAIAQILNPASSLKRLTLDFDIAIKWDNFEDVQHNIANILCASLHSLLAQSASPSGLINLQANSDPILSTISVPPDVIRAMLTGNSDLMQFVEKGKLILT